MIVVIQTQVYENYAAHTGFDGTHRWKAKGGSEYKITGVPEHTDVNSVVELVRDQIEQNNDYFQISIVGSGPESDNYMSWFEQSQLDYEGEVVYPEPQIEYASLVDKVAV